MLIDCACGATNRVPGMSKQRHRCGKCKHVFTPQELTKARQEPAPPRPSLSDLFGNMGDMFGEDPFGENQE